MEHLAYTLYRGAWGSLDWLFPPDCGGCNKPGSRWCQACQDAVQKICPPLCEQCGRSLENGKLCLACRQSPPRFTALRSWGIFGGPLREALHCLKYKGNMSMGEMLARHLIDLAACLPWQIDLVTPVPQGLDRKAERGYNQAALLAWPVALALGWKYRPQALKKIRTTRTQVGLSHEQRWENVSGAYWADPKLVQDKQILVIDDVTTSGATLDGCAASLIEAGARSVYGLTLARAGY